MKSSQDTQKTASSLRKDGKRKWIDVHGFFFISLARSYLQIFSFAMAGALLSLYMKKWINKLTLLHFA